MCWTTTPSSSHEDDGAADSRNGSCWAYWARRTSPRRRRSKPPSGCAKPRCWSGWNYLSEKAKTRSASFPGRQHPRRCGSSARRRRRVSAAARCLPVPRRIPGGRRRSRLRFPSNFLSRRATTCSKPASTTVPMTSSARPQPGSSNSDVREGLQVLAPSRRRRPRQHRPSAARRTAGDGREAHYRLREVEQAVGCFEQRLVFAREISDRLGESSALGNLGVAYAAVGEVEKAIITTSSILPSRARLAIGKARAARSAISASPMPPWVRYGRRSVITSSISSHFREKPATGWARVVRSAIRQRLPPPRRGGEDHRLLRAGHSSSARSVTAGGKAPRSAILAAPISAWARSRKAIACQEQHLNIAREIGDREGEGNALGNLGLAYAGLGEVEKAQALLLQAKVIGEAIRDPQIIENTKRALAERTKRQGHRLRTATSEFACACSAAPYR